MHQVADERRERQDDEHEAQGTAADANDPAIQEGHTAAACGRGGRHDGGKSLGLAGTLGGLYPCGPNCTTALLDRLTHSSVAHHGLGSGGASDGFSLTDGCGDGVGLSVGATLALGIGDGVGVGDRPGRVGVGTALLCGVAVAAGVTGASGPRTGTGTWDGRFGVDSAGGTPGSVGLAVGVGLSDAVGCEALGGPAASPRTPSLIAVDVGSADTGSELPCMMFPAITAATRRPPAADAQTPMRCGVIPRWGPSAHAGSAGGIGAAPTSIATRRSMAVACRRHRSQLHA